MGLYWVKLRTRIYNFKIHEEKENARNFFENTRTFVERYLKNENENESQSVSQQSVSITF